MPKPRHAAHALQHSERVGAAEGVAKCRPYRARAMHDRRRDSQGARLQRRDDKIIADFFNALSVFDRIGNFWLRWRIDHGIVDF